MALRLNAIRVKDAKIEKFASKNMYSATKKDLKVYEFPAKEEEYANAIITLGLIKRIFISDYLIARCTEDELKAIILHEIGC